MIELTIPGEPVGKARARVTQHGTYTPAKTVNYEALVKQIFAASYPGWVPVEGPLTMRVIAYYAITQSTSAKQRGQMEAGIVRPTRRPDCDNLIKIVADALNGVAYRDDAQLVGVGCGKWYSDRPRVEVKIEREVG